MCLSGKTQFYLPFISLRCLCPGKGNNGRLKRMRKGHYAIWKLIHYIYVTWFVGTSIALSAWFRKVGLTMTLWRLNYPATGSTRVQIHLWWVADCQCTELCSSARLLLLLLFTIMFQKCHVKVGVLRVYVCGQYWLAYKSPGADSASWKWDTSWIAETATISVSTRTLLYGVICGIKDEIIETYDVWSV